jgi:hypothetical protein
LWELGSSALAPRWHPRPNPAREVVRLILHDSDGIGPHEHGGWPLHDHGEPKFSPEEASYLLSRGLHVDQHHGRVCDERGGSYCPLTVSQMLAAGRADGKLEAAKPAQGGGKKR